MTKYRGTQINQYPVLDTFKDKLDNICMTFDPIKEEQSQTFIH